MESQSKDNFNGQTHKVISDEYLKQFKDVLDHWHDEQWLSKSPLAKSFIFNLKLSSIEQCVEELKRRVLKAKDSLQKYKDHDLQLLLEKRFFDLEAISSKQAIQNAQDALGIKGGRYYEIQKEAIEQLARAYLKSLTPPGNIPVPSRPQDFIKLNDIDLLRKLEDKRVRSVTLYGPSGIGKTSVAIDLANEWQSARKPVFWYTVRVGVNDQLEQFIYSLAYFLHQQGQSSLWTQLISQPNHPFNTHFELIAGIIRQSLINLHPNQALLCFDEVDLLLQQDSIKQSEEHQRLKAFITMLIETSSHTKFLLVGQRILISPNPPADLIFELQAWDDKTVFTLLLNNNITLSDADLAQLQKIVHGNPLIIRLFIALHHSGELVSSTLQRIRSNFSLDWFLARIWSHLTLIEMQVLKELSVFSLPVDRNIWREEDANKALSSLIQRMLVDVNLGNDTVSLRDIFRENIYQKLTNDVRGKLNLWAADQMSQRFEYTIAAQHFAKADSFDLAISIWYEFSEQETNRGRSGSALTLLRSIEPNNLSSDDTRRLWALSISRLLRNIGETEDALEILNRVSWLSSQSLQLKAQELRAELLLRLGQIEASLKEYRAIEEKISLFEMRLKRVSVKCRIASIYNLQDPQPDLARSELNKAQFEVEVIYAQLEDFHGQPNLARNHLKRALALAETIKEKQILAKVHDQIGVLEAHQINIEQAEYHLKQAGKYYQACGMDAAAIAVENTNLSCAYILARDYEKAIEPAQKAIRFFEDAKHPYWCALNFANLAEAYFYTSKVDEAKEFAQKGISTEEIVVRPYCLYVLAHIEKHYKHFESAEEQCLEAIKQAREVKDLWAEGPARRTLGEIYLDWGKTVDAQQAFDEALNIYRKLGVQKEVDYIIAHYPLSNSGVK